MITELFLIIQVISLIIIIKNKLITRKFPLFPWTLISATTPILPPILITHQQHQRWIQMVYTITTTAMVLIIIIAIIMMAPTIQTITVFIRGWIVILILYQDHVLLKQLVWLTGYWLTVTQAKCRVTLLISICTIFLDLKLILKIVFSRALS